MNYCIFLPCREVGLFICFLPTCQCPPVSIHLSVPTCRCSPVSTHLSVPTCQYPPVSTHLSVPTCQYPPVSIHLSLTTCHYPPDSAHLSLPVPTCQCPRVWCVAISLLKLNFSSHSSVQTQIVFQFLITLDVLHPSA